MTYMVLLKWCCPITRISVFPHSQDDWLVSAEEIKELMVELDTNVNNMIGDQRSDEKYFTKIPKLSSPAKTSIDDKPTSDPVKEPMPEADEWYFPEAFSACCIKRSGCVGL
jgi:hypothetical protein